MGNVGRIDLEALPLQDPQLKVQELRRNSQTIGCPEEIVTFFQSIHDLCIFQKELGRKDIGLIFHAICVVKQGKLMECA